MFTVAYTVDWYSLVVFGCLGGGGRSGDLLILWWRCTDFSCSRVVLGLRLRVMHSAPQVQGRLPAHGERQPAGSRTRAAILFVPCHLKHFVTWRLCKRRLA